MSVRIICADVMDGLRQLEDESVHCVVTSPPYWGLRDYGVSGQLGLEPTLGDHIAKMVAVFREVRRVLRKDGTFWLNYGDCFATSVNGRSAANTKALGNDDRTFRDKPFSTVGGALKSKDLCMIPHRLAIALQEDGWWVRMDVVWAKPNPMPESIIDRPTKAHEYVFLLSKSDRYFYDAEAIREVRTGDEDAKIFRGGSYVGGDVGPRTVVGNKRIGKPTRGRDTYGRHTLNGAIPDKQRRTGNALPARRRGHARCHQGFNAEQIANGRNKRSVWTIATAPFPEAHFATFPPEIPEICIKAGCPVGGTMLDPFAGAGTSLLVADRLQRHAIGIELNPEYVAMAERRLANDRGALLDIIEQPSQPKQLSLLEQDT
jgi:DNA modification methylase